MPFGTRWVFATFMNVSVLVAVAEVATGCPKHTDAAACDGWSGEPDPPLNPPIGALHPPRALPNAAGEPSVVRAGAPEKLFQLVGDLDRESAPPARTPLQTETRFGLVGTDLGFPVLHKGRMVLFFGDAIPRKPFDAARRPPDADVVGYVDVPSTPMPVPTRSGGIDLRFFLDDDGQYLAARLDGQLLGRNQVPYAGFSDGARLYGVFYVGAEPGRSVIGASPDDGRSFAKLVDVPTDRIGFLVPQVVPTAEIGGLAAQWSDPRTVLMWARPRQQEGEPLFLAAAPLGRIADASTWRYYAPTAAGDAWSANVGDAPGVFTRAPDEKCRGPFSVDFVPGLEKWLLIERCLPHHFAFRVADGRLGPWSAPQVLYDRDADGGLCHFMHRLCDPGVRDPSAPGACCDADYQPEIYCKFGPNAGDVRPYGPGVLTPYGTYDPAARTATLYFLMSVLNPYSPMVMRGALRAR